MRIRPRANFRAMCIQLISSGRWTTCTEGAAGFCERRQKAKAVLICFSLLDAAARGIRVEEENRSERKLGQIAELGPDWEIDPTLRSWKHFLIAQQEI